jgi:exonuclease III
MVCNVQGLNDRVRRTGVTSPVNTMNSSIVCLQETKLLVQTPTIVMETLGSDFDVYFCLPATNARGGIM